MKNPNSPLLAAIYLLLSPAYGDTLQLEFPKSAQDGFHENPSIRVDAVRKEGVIEIQVTNISKNWITITKHPHGWDWRYLKEDGTEEESGAMFVPATPKERLDHLVLRPKGHTKNKLTFSTTTVWKIPETHTSAASYDFSIHLSGFFPPLDEYITFSITGKLDVKTK